MAAEIKPKVLHEYLLTKCIEHIIEFTKRCQLKCNTPKINKLKIDLTPFINKGGSSEKIINI